ncbi:MAG: isopenicillin N synthase family dioxygenase [Granulosicoccus sp.]
MTIPSINAASLFDPDHVNYRASVEAVRVAAEDIGFMTITNTTIDASEVQKVMNTYREFFMLPDAQKAVFDMATTGSNRGWGAPGAEQVDSAANPDYKEVFDCGLELDVEDPLVAQTYYAPNRWPDHPAGFRSVVQDYYDKVTAVSLALLTAVAQAVGQPADYFTDKFDKPMALLRGNYYPPRPPTAGSKDFGIAPHTDYGCLTLLATDGTPGLEIQDRNGHWAGISASPGTFVVNFGEMLQMWTAGQVVATPHRVLGGSEERISVPFFFNPRFDANVAPPGSSDVVLAGEHLAKRYDETYVHRQTTGNS